MLLWRKLSKFIDSIVIESTLSHSNKLRALKLSGRPNTKLDVFDLDGSGVRTSPINIVTITADNNSNPYDGFGTALLFRNRIYSGGPTPGGIREGARIRTSLKNNSTVNYGTDLHFDVTPTGDGSLINVLSLSLIKMVGVYFFKLLSIMNF
jgi:hypothetical protein